MSSFKSKWVQEQTLRPLNTQKQNCFGKQIASSFLNSEFLNIDKQRSQKDSPNQIFENLQNQSHKISNDINVQYFKLKNKNNAFDLGLNENEKLRQRYNSQLSNYRKQDDLIKLRKMSFQIDLKQNNLALQKKLTSQKQSIQGLFGSKKAYNSKMSTPIQELRCEIQKNRREFINQNTFIQINRKTISNFQYLKSQKEQKKDLNIETFQDLNYLQEQEQDQNFISESVLSPESIQRYMKPRQLNLININNEANMKNLNIDDIISQTKDSNTKNRKSNSKNNEKGVSSLLNKSNSPQINLDLNLGTVVCSNKSIKVRNGSDLSNNFNAINKIGFNNQRLYLQDESTPKCRISKDQAFQCL